LNAKQATLTETIFGTFINGLTAKNTLVDADEVVLDDSADSSKAKKTSWLNVWTNYLKPKSDAFYQAILVSGTNIKTINGSSVLGSGDLTVTGSTPSQSAYTMLANNTASSAVPTEQVFENITNATYDGATPTWTGTTAPSGATQHTYSLSQVGNMVTLIINLSYATAGSGLTGVNFDLPSTAPTPVLPTSVSATGDVISYGIGMISTSRASALLNQPFCSFRLKSTSPNVCEVSISRTTANYRHAYATIQYFV
jgi:hypothetical protein